MPVNLIQYRGIIGVFNCQKYVCANSSNLCSDKLFPKFRFQSLLGLLLMNAIFLSLLFFGLSRKNFKTKVKKIQFLLSRALHSVTVILLIHHIWLHGLLIKIRGNAELNPRPNQKQHESLLNYHWNLNIISDHIFQKLELFQSYYSINNIEILCLSETFLDSDISGDNDNLQLPRFKLIRADYLSSTKKRESIHLLTKPPTFKINWPQRDSNPQPLSL